MKRWWWLFPLFAVAGVGVGWMAAVVVAYVQPKTFDSQAVVQIMPPGSVHLTADSDSPSSTEAGPGFLEREMRMLKSKGLLEAAVTQAEFDKKWAMTSADAVAILSHSITVEQLRGTELVSIRARHINREDARDMVLATITVYRNQRKARELAESEIALNALSEAIRKQEEKVEERRKILTDFVREKTLLHDNEGVSPPARRRASPIDTEAYVAKKREFESELAKLQETKLRQVTEKVFRRLDPEGLVVHEEPAVALVPSGPDFVAYMKKGLIGGLLVSQVVALLLVILLPSRTSAR